MIGSRAIFNVFLASGSPKTDPREELLPGRAQSSSLFLESVEAIRSRTKQKENSNQRQDDDEEGSALGRRSRSSILVVWGEVM